MLHQTSWCFLSMKNSQGSGWWSLSLPRLSRLCLKHWVVAQFILFCPKYAWPRHSSTAGLGARSVIATVTIWQILVAKKVCEEIRAGHLWFFVLFLLCKMALKILFNKLILTWGRLLWYSLPRSSLFCHHLPGGNFLSLTDEPQTQNAQLWKRCSSFNASPPVTCLLHTAYPLLHVLLNRQVAAAAGDHCTTIHPRLDFIPRLLCCRRLLLLFFFLKKLYSSTQQILWGRGATLYTPNTYIY